MAKGVRVHGDKVWLWGEAKDRVLYLAQEMEVEPEEAFRRVFDMGYQSWMDERRRRDRPKRPRAY